MWAVSAVVSATAPLFMLVMFFQRQVISGLTAGAAAPAVNPLITCLWKNMTNINKGAVAETTAETAHIKLPSC